MEKTILIDEDLYAVAQQLENAINSLIDQYQDKLGLSYEDANFYVYAKDVVAIKQGIHNQVGVKVSVDGLKFKIKTREEANHQK